MIIPGHGPMARRADLVRYRDMLIAPAQPRRPGHRGGPDARPRSRRSAIADAYGRRHDFISPDSFIETIYRSLIRDRRPAAITSAAPNTRAKIVSTCLK